VVQANVAAACSTVAASEVAGQVLNIACGERWSLLDLLKKLESALQQDAAVVFGDRRVGDVKHSQASIEKARRLLGYAPAVDFDEGIKRTVAWFMESSGRSVTSGDHGIPDRAVAGKQAGRAVQGFR